jgi:hypothetical protein
MKRLATWRTRLVQLRRPVHRGPHTKRQDLGVTDGHFGQIDSTRSSGHPIQPARKYVFYPECIIISSMQRPANRLLPFLAALSKTPPYISACLPGNAVCCGRSRTV